MALIQGTWPQVEALPWVQNLRNGHCFVANVAPGAGTGQYATTDIFVPSTASIEVVVLDIVVSTPSTAVVYAGTETASFGGAPTTPTNASIGGPGPVSTVTSGAASAQPPSGLFAGNIGANLPVHLFSGYAVGLGAGQGLRFGLATGGTSMWATIWWMEGG